MLKNACVSRLVAALLIVCGLSLPVTAQWEGVAIGNDGAGSHAAVPEGEGCDGGYDVQGAGHDIWGTNDAFYYMYQTELMPGNFEASCRVESLEPTNPEATHEWAKGGIMARNTLTDDSVNAYLAVNMGVPADNTNRRVSQQGRDGAGADSWSSHAPGFNCPIYIRLVRSGNTFQSFYRYDPADPWVPWRIHDTPNAAPEMNLGFAVTSHLADNPDNPYEARFCDIQFQDLAEASIAGFAVSAEDGNWRLNWAKDQDFDHYVIGRYDAEGYKELAADYDGTANTFLDEEPLAENSNLVMWTVRPYTAAGPCPEASAQRYTAGVTPDGYILNWLLLGPYMAQGCGTPQEYLRKSFITDGTVTEETICPAAGMQIDTDYTKAAPPGLYRTPEAPGLNPDAVPTWFQYMDTDWLIDLDGEIYNANVERVGTVACCYAVNTTEEAIPVVWGGHSDDSLYVSVNNEEAMCVSACRGWGSRGAPQNTGETVLLPGLNKIIVKVTDGDWGDGFALRMTTPGGDPIGQEDGVEVTLDPGEGIPQAVITSSEVPDVLAPEDLPFEVTFSATASHCGGASINSYQWDFGNGQTAEGLEPDPVAYSEAGEYTVILAMTDENGVTGHATTTVEIYLPPEPAPNFCDEFDVEGDPLASGNWILDDPANLVGNGVSLENGENGLHWVNNEGVNSDNWCNLDNTPKFLAYVKNRDFSFETRVTIAQQTEQWRQIGAILTWDTFPNPNHCMWGFIRDHIRLEQCGGNFTCELNNTQYPGGPCEDCGYTASFRIDRIGDFYAFYHRSDDGDPWQYGGGTTFENPPAHVGIMAKNWSGAGFTADFAYACLGDPDPSLLPQGTGITELFADEFEDDSFDPLEPPAPWQLDDPDGHVAAGNITISSDGEKLNYVCAQGVNTDNWCCFQHSADIAVPVGEMDPWAFETRVTVNSRAGNTTQAGLILDWETFPPVPRGQVMFGPILNDLGLEGCGTVPGDRVRARQGEFAEPPFTISLKAQREGTSYSFFYRDEDSQPWSYMDTITLGPSPDTIAIFGKNWGGPAFDISFHYAKLSEELEPLENIDPGDFTGFAVTGEEYLRSVDLDKIEAADVAIEISPSGGAVQGDPVLDSGGTFRFIPTQAETYTVTLKDSADENPSVSFEVVVRDNVANTDEFEAAEIAPPWYVINPGPSGEGQPAAQFGLQDGKYWCLLPQGGHFDEWGDGAGNQTWHNAVQLVRTDINPAGNWIIETKNDLFACRTDGFRDNNQRASFQGLVVGFLNTEEDDNPDNDLNWFQFGELDDFSNQQTVCTESMGNSLFGGSRGKYEMITQLPVTYRVRKEGNRYQMEYKDPGDGTWKIHWSGTVDPKYVPVYVGIINKKWGTLSEYETEWDNFTIKPYVPTCPTDLVLTTEGRNVTVQWNGMGLSDVTLTVDDGNPVEVPEGLYAYTLEEVPAGTHTITLDSTAGEAACESVSGEVSIPLGCPSGFTAALCEEPGCAENDVKFTWTSNDTYESLEIGTLDTAQDPPLYTKVADVPFDATEFYLRDVTPAGTYTYVLVAKAGTAECQTETATVDVPSPAVFLLLGDANGDRQIDISDPIYLLNYTMGVGPKPSCAQAVDVNDDDALDISDGISLLGYLFANTPMKGPDGEEISPPHPGCVKYPSSDVTDIQRPEELPGCGNPCIP